VVGDGAALVVDDDIERLLTNEEPVLFDEEHHPPTALDGAALGLRLAVAGEPVGLLALAAQADGPPLEVGDVAFVASLAGPLAAALVNTRAYEEIESLNLDLENRVRLRTHELAEINRELEHLNMRKDELVATVSHDFRSPLASIRQNVQTILRDLGEMEGDDLRHFLEGIARQESRLSSMSENLLDLARLKETRAPEDTIDLEALVRGLFEAFDVRAEQAGIELKLEIGSDTPTEMLGDPDRMGQVLQNLVDNAMKFTPRDGLITVRLDLPADAHDRDESLGLVIDVSDSGVGIPEEAIPRLFEPFFQVPRQSHAGQGSGLGLAIVKAVVEAHGGRISVSNRDGGGTTFRIDIPAERLPARPV